jgi:hypothetical protein
MISKDIVNRVENKVEILLAKVQKFYKDDNTIEFIIPNIIDIPIKAYPIYDILVKPEPDEPVLVLRNNNISTDFFYLPLRDDGKIYIKNNKVEIETDKDGKNLTIRAEEIKIEGTSVQPNGMGGFCALPQCLFTGATHIGDTLKK